MFLGVTGLSSDPKNKCQKPPQCLLVFIKWRGDERRKFCRNQNASFLLGSGWLSWDGWCREPYTHTSVCHTHAHPILEGPVTSHMSPHISKTPFVKWPTGTHLNHGESQSPQSPWGSSWEAMLGWGRASIDQSFGIRSCRCHCHLKEAWMC